MTEPARRTSPAITSIGDQLAVAWKAQEAKQRRGRRALVAIVAALTLALPGAYAGEQLLVGTPGPHRDTTRNGRSTILTSGRTPSSSWKLTAFRRGATTCFGLRAVTNARVFYGADCDPAFPATHAVTFGTQTVGGETFIYGATTADATRVRVTIGGKTVEAPLVEPEPEAAQAARTPAGVRVFVIALTGVPPIPAAVVVTAKDGRIVGRA
jgi:hypothetical protein